MNKYNKFLVYCFLTGLLAVFVGATQKLSGNENYHFAIFAGLTLESLVITFFIIHNYNRLRFYLSELNSK